MPITCQGAQRIYTIYISGDIDHHGARNLLAQIDEELSRNMPHTLTLDLSGVSFMDSSGIALLMRCQQRMTELSGRMEVVHVPSQALRMLKAAKLDRHINIKEEV